MILGFFKSYAASINHVWQELTIYYNNSNIQTNMSDCVMFSVINGLLIPETFIFSKVPSVDLRAYLLKTILDFDSGNMNTDLKNKKEYLENNLYFRQQKVKQEESKQFSTWGTSNLRESPEKTKNDLISLKIIEKEKHLVKPGKNFLLY